MPIIKNLRLTTTDNTSIHIEKMTCSMEEFFSMMKMDTNNHTAHHTKDIMTVEKSVESEEEDEECVINFDTLSSSLKLKSGTTEYNKSYYERKKNDPDFKEKCRLRGRLQYLKKKDDPATKEKKRYYNKLYRERKLLEKQQNEETTQNETA
jgi:hypothetical protein